MNNTRDLLLRQSNPLSARLASLRRDVDRLTRMTFGGGGADAGIIFCGLPNITIVSDNTEKSVTGDIPIPLTFLGGESIIHVLLTGIHINNTAGTKTLTFKAYYGPLALETQISETVTDSILTVSTYYEMFETWFHVDPNTTANILCAGRIQYGNTTVATSRLMSEISTLLASPTVDNRNFKITIQHSNINASLSFTSTRLLVELWPATG